MPKTDTRPNILLIVADQHRYDCVGFAGKYPVRTPNLDKLASEGAFFDRAFTPFPVCAPARQAMLTGIMPDSYGALFNYDFIPVPSIKPDSNLWPSRLAAGGYLTAFVGRWHASMGFGAQDFGYINVYEISQYNDYVNHKYPDVKYLNGWFGEESSLPYEDSQPHYLAEKVCNYIDEYSRTGSPWHVRLDLTVPHLPCRPSKPFSTMYGPEDTAPWDGFGDTLENKPYIQRQQILNWGLENRNWDQWAEVAAHYYAMISQIDDALGIIFSTLEAAGAAQNTVVIYTSDHGDMCGSHGMIDKHYVLYDDILRVPLIIKWPGRTKPRRINEFVSNCMDLPATIAEIAGIETKTGKGVSLMPLAEGCRQPRPGYCTASSNGQQFGLFTQRCIRTEKWKYIWNLTDVDELYDLENDCGEKINLIKRENMKEAVAWLRKTLHEELLRLDDPFVKSGWLNKQLLENRKY